MNEDELAAKMPLPEFVSVAYAAEILGGLHHVAPLMDLVATGDLASWSHSVPGRDASIHIDHATGVRTVLPYIATDTDPGAVLIWSDDVLWSWCLDLEMCLQKGHNLPPKKRVETRLAALKKRASMLKLGKTAQVSHRTRSDLLTPLIQAAQQQCSDPLSASEVFSVLRSWAESKPPRRPLRGVSEIGLKWDDPNDDVRELTLKNLRDRLKRVPKTR